MKNPRYSITLTPDMYQQLKNIAAKKNCSVGEVCRTFIQEGLNGNLSQANIDFILPLMRSEIKNVLQPGIERLAALSAKSCMQSGTAAYLCAETLANYVPLSQQREFEEAYNAARKKAAKDIKRNIDSDEI